MADNLGREVVGSVEKGGELMKVKLKVERVCYVCSKVFGSGKALGGHMRIHLRRSSDEPAAGFCSAASAGVVHRPICRICGKNFPSMKSLFGHMRCHPDRGWRGIHPPLKSSSLSSSILSDPSEADGDDDDDVEVLSSDHRNSGATDLTSLLKAWPLTAKRGRKAVAVSSSSVVWGSDDDRLHEAVKYLMMLAGGNPIASVAERQKCNESSFCKEEIHQINQVFEPKKPLIDRSVNEVEKSGTGGESVKINEHSHSSDEGGQLDDKYFDYTAVQMIKNRKKRKKRCLGSILEAPLRQGRVEANRRVLDFDLNEMPPQPEYEVGFA